MSFLRSPFAVYRAWNTRVNSWINRKQHRGEHVAQAMIGVNMVAGIMLLTQVQRWRLGSFDERMEHNIATVSPQLLEQYEQEMADSIRISELREAELRAEAAERTAQGLPPDHSAPARVVRVYDIDGRERRVVFINSNPIGFDVRLREYREKMEQLGAAPNSTYPLSSSSSPTSTSSSCADCH